MSFDEQINKYLYDWGKTVTPILSTIAGINAFVSLMVLVYRYGFILSDEELFSLFRGLDIMFAVFAILYLVRYLLSLNRIAFLRSTWIEGFLNIFIVIHGIVNYVFDYKLLYFLAEWMDKDTATLQYQHVLSIYLMILVLTEITKISTYISHLSIKPSVTFIFSFILLISVGTGLLMLPKATEGPYSMNFLDALFTSVSASCVTGLAVVDTGQFFTFKGHLVILFLAQVGGIGIVSFATFFATFLSKGVGLKHQSIIQDFLSSEDLSSATSLLRRVIIITLSIEFIGFIGVYLSWNEELIFDSTAQKVFYSLFHSVSAFCNAGFSLFPDGLNTSILSDATTEFNQIGMSIEIRRMYGLHLVIAFLIIFGSMGFTTIEDLFTPSTWINRVKAPWKNMKIGTKMALYSNILLLILGTIVVMVLEFDELKHDKTIVEALITAFFQSVTTRTAGFNTMDFGSMSDATIIIMMFLMFVGAAPGSTGGGIKCTTFYVLLLSAISDIRGQERIVIGRRTISNSVIRKSYSLFMFATTYNILAIFLLSMSESGNPDISILQIAFEQVSAFGTAGISMGITSDLSSLGKVIIIISMYIGRVGTLTLALALSSTVNTNKYRYPEDHVMVG